MNSNIISQPEEKFRSVLILGAPGSGKGTQGEFLSSVGNHLHLSSGEIFRGISSESPAGKMYRKYVERGELLPDNVIIEIWYHYLLGLIATNRYTPKNQLLILDGIPRTVEQAKSLNPYIQVQKIIVLETRKTECLIQRLKRRALIEQRDDDKSTKVLHRRMEIYEQETSLLIQYYSRELLIYINADQRPLEVLRDILVVMSDLL